MPEMELKGPMMSKETFKRAEEETRKDTTLRQLVQVVRSGWPVDKSLLS